MRKYLTRVELRRQSAWILASLLVIFLGVAIVSDIDDVLDGPEVSPQISTISRSVNDQANVPAGPITADVRLGQTFRAAEPELSEVAIMLATYGRKNDVSVIFSLWEDPPGAAPLRTVTAQPETIADNAYHDFRFAPVPDTSGKTFLIILESPRATPDNAFTVWMGDCDCYPEGIAFLNGAEIPQRDLAFRAGYHQEVSSVMGELTNRLSQYKPWFFKGGFLASIGLASLGLTLFAVGYFTSTLIDGEKGPLQWAWSPVWALVMIAVTLWFASQ